MSLTDIKEQKLFSEWSKQNEDKNIFEKNKENDSFYTDRPQENARIWKYQFSTVREAEDMVSSILGEKMEPEIRRLAIISAFKCKRLSEKITENNEKVLERESGKELPEYIYVF